MKIKILHKKENDDGVRISEKITQNIRMAGGSTFIRIIGFGCGNVYIMEKNECNCRNNEVMN